MLNQHQTDRSKEAVSVPIDMMYDEIDSLPEKIRSGKAVLEVVAYPWGVEFDVCETSSPS